MQTGVLDSDLGKGSLSPSNLPLMEPEPLKKRTRKDWDNPAFRSTSPILCLCRRFPFAEDLPVHLPEDGTRTLDLKDPGEEARPRTRGRLRISDLRLSRKLRSRREGSEEAICVFFN